MAVSVTSTRAQLGVSPLARAIGQAAQGQGASLLEAALWPGKTAIATALDMVETAGRMGELRQQVSVLTLTVSERRQRVAAEKLAAESRAVQTAEAASAEKGENKTGAKALGSNEAEQKRALALALDGDAIYQAESEALAQAEAQLDELTAELASLRDLQSARGYLVDALKLAATSAN
jgi:hypothetical protein